MNIEDLARTTSVRSSIDSTGRLAGKYALVTGAASGLGLAITHMFVEQGAVVIMADRNHELLAEEAAQLDGGVVPFEIDIVQAGQWAALSEQLNRIACPLHILVNCAGVCRLGSIEEISVEDWRTTHAVNLDGVFLACQVMLPLIVQTLRANGGRGSILNISSVSAMVAGRNLAAYNSSKAAVRHLTKSIALHCAHSDYPVTCNSLHPTFINTPMLGAFNGRSEEGLARLAKQIPAGRVGEPDDVAYAATYLCSDEAKFVTGAELLIDGGLAAG